MPERLLLIAARIVLLLLVIPVLIAEVSPSESRTLRGIELQGTTYEEVRFRNSAQELHLARMLFLPGFSNVIAYLSSFYIRSAAQKGFGDAIGNYGPLPYWGEVDVPVLVMYGEQDTNVPSKESADRLNTLGNPNLRVAVFEGSRHPLEDREGTGDSYFQKDALALMCDFILDAVSAS